MKPLSTTKRYRLLGDWMIDGLINNFNRSRRLNIQIINGKAYTADEGFTPEPLHLDEDDRLDPGGASIHFLPDPGRIGREFFPRRADTDA